MNFNINLLHNLTRTNIKQVCFHSNNIMINNEKRCFWALMHLKKL